MGRNDACFCGSGKKQKNCHSDVDERSMVANILRLYNRLDIKIEKHYLSGSKKHKCEKGCSECCYNQTPISEIEYNIIQYELLKWAKDDIKALGDRVGHLWVILNEKHPDFVKELETSYQGQMITNQEVTERFIKDFADLPCPFLSLTTNECLVYSVRPLICRMFGVAFKELDPYIDWCSKLHTSELMEFGCNVDDFKKEVLDLLWWKNANGQNLNRRPFPIIYHLFKSFYKSDGITYINNFIGKFQKPEDMYKQAVFDYMYKRYNS